MTPRRVSLVFALIVLAASPLLAWGENVGSHPDLPNPYATAPTKRFVNITGWPANTAPTAPKGFTVTKFAGDLDNPRWLYVLPNGDVLVSGDRIGSWHNEPNRITLLRDADGDGVAEKRSTFLKGLDKPFGMALRDGKLYVGEQGAVLRYPYQDGETEITAEGEKILELPTGGYNYHWTRNLLFSKDSKKLYVSVGSASNAGEGGMDDEKRRARILEVNADGTGEHTYGFGLRNPVGMGWEPTTGKLWCVVNERDNLGDDLVPDFLTSVTPGGFYGWPLFYFGNHRDPRWNGEPPEWARHALTPDYALGSHVAPLGLAFYTASQFPEKYRNGAFVAEHGSWNRSSFVGYKVVFIPFKNGKPAGEPEDFLTGFLHDAARNIGFGRPVGIAIAKDGGLLVADDAGGMVWKVSAVSK